MSDIVQRLRDGAASFAANNLNEGTQRNLLAAADEIERLRKAGEWRDIASAPTDGTPVLLFARHIHATASIRIVGHHVPDIGWINVSFAGQGLSRLVPSAWQQLPDFSSRVPTLDPGERP